MSDEPPEDSWRPELGFVVEGDGEYQSYPTILAKALGYPCGHLPIVNAGGCSNLLADLEDYLDQLRRLRAPRRVIVSVDSRDFRDHPEFSNCVVLKEHLDARAVRWLEEVRRRGVVDAPSVIAIVIQHQSFESWLIADTDGLRTATDLIRIEHDVQWTNVDVDIPSPVSWLKERLLGATNPKNPFLQKRLAGILDAERARRCSKSLDKFLREVQSAMNEAAPA